MSGIRVLQISYFCVLQVFQILISALLLLNIRFPILLWLKMLDVDFQTYETESYPCLNHHFNVAVMTGWMSDRSDLPPTEVLPF